MIKVCVDRCWGAVCWGQKRLSRNQRIKSHFLAETFSTHPITKNKQSISAEGRAGSNARPARPSAELDRTTSSAICRAGPVQFGGWPSWIKRATSSAIRRAGPVQFNGGPCWIKRATSSVIRRARPIQFGGWPSWNNCAVLVLSARLLSRLYRTRSCFVSIGGTVGTLRFRNRKNLFSRKTFGSIV